MKKIFSIPFNSFITPVEFQNIYIPFVKEHKEYLYDIYFSYPLEPFNNDAMGQAFKMNKTMADNTLRVMLDIQKKLGVSVSVTFNDITLPATEENLNIFLKSFSRLYNLGIRSVTIPHIHWLYDGRIKQMFPDLFIKNTILRKVSKAQNYVDYVNAGFDAIYIDRVNIRDRDNLRRLKKAYEKYKIPIALLINESCRGNCPAMDEHYILNCDTNSNSYFKQSISRFTCSMWSSIDNAYSLRSANLTCFKEDYDELLNFVQIFKLHGRSEKDVLFDSIKIVKDYVNNKTIVGNDWLIQKGYDNNKLKQWREYIKNCKFECWDCDVCDQLEKTQKRQF